MGFKGLNPQVIRDSEVEATSHSACLFSPGDEVFFDEIFECITLNAYVSIHSLQFTILLLKLFIGFKLARLQATIFRLPVVQCCRADPMPPAEVHPSYCLRIETICVSVNRPFLHSSLKLKISNFEFFAF